MANEEQLERLRQDVHQWNDWRINHPEILLDLRRASLREADLSKFDLRRANLREADLCGASLYEADLRGANLSKVNLYKANLREANLRRFDFREANLRRFDLIRTDLNGADLREADLSDADLRGANLSGANLSGANLSRTSLREADLSGVKLIRFDLSGADLREADLSGANLLEVNLSNANLSGARLVGTKLGGANISRTNLCRANLRAAQALRTKFEFSVFTGACLEDWNINSATSFDGALCEYVYLKVLQQERRPRKGTFKPGEFSALVQKAVDTVDLIFKDGIDWQAFFQSFQELRSQYAAQDLSIQAIEKKRGGAFVVRIEVAEGADKSAIESDAKQLYESQLKTIEAQYENQLRLQGAHLEDIQSILKFERDERTRLSKVVEKMAEGQETPKYDLRNAQFASGFAETVQGNQVGGTINNYGPNAEDITRLLTALRDQAQTFPTDQKDDANDVLDDLERDLAEEQPDKGRIGRRLKKLVALGTAIGTIASGAAAVSGDVSTFTGNVIELTEQLGIPVEQVQLPASGTP